MSTGRSELAVRLGRALQQAREPTGLTQAQVADRLGVGTRTVSYDEQGGDKQGRHGVTMARATACLALYGVDSRWLLQAALEHVGQAGAGRPHGTHVQPPTGPQGPACPVVETPVAKLKSKRSKRYQIARGGSVSFEKR